MRIPTKHIVIAGHKIPIKFKHKMSLGGTDIWGLYDDNTHTIYLQRGMDKNHRAEVLLHECIHAISFIHNFQLTEKAVNILGIELLAMIKNNKLDLR